MSICLQVKDRKQIHLAEPHVYRSISNHLRQFDPTAQAKRAQVVRAQPVDDVKVTSAATRLSHFGERDASGSFSLLHVKGLSTLRAGAFCAEGHWKAPAGAVERACSQGHGK
ncbi:hypothetical protein HNY73_015340 [Argiope bruennichi]|uniref:Uncharacterized protein n=1 Tax=Argiope bruennichi TaxID=94029 RepID=A0A8T0ESB9_ARGBR|nr:hypothetical protein HNY73_015340 [Argiope bruennichi]